MPGLTVVAGSDVDTTAAIAAVTRSANPSYVVETLLEIERKLVVAWSAPEGYPRTVIRSAEGLCVLEGIVPRLSAPQLQAELQELIESLNENPVRGIEVARRWANETDGDFVVLLAAARSDRVFLATDAFGRLRTYASEVGSQIAIAREIKTLVALYGPGDVDRIAVAEILMFGFPLGARTPHASVRAMVPGTATQIRFEPFGYETAVLRTWDFESLVRPHKPGLINELAERFEAECAAHARTQTGALHLQLSGGLDSRAVAAGLARSKIQFSASTYQTAQIYRDDVPMAQEVARILDVPWKLFDFSAAPTWDDCAETVMLRDGLNPMKMSYVLMYLKALRREYGGASVFTGDGGDRLLEDLRAPSWAHTANAYVWYLLQETFWSLSAAAAFVGLDKRSLRDAVVSHVLAYPERSGCYRGMHFIMMEKTSRWLFEGEERNRSFLRHQAPFYGRAFFDLAMSVHPNEKRGDHLRLALIRTLEPRLARLPNLGKLRLSNVIGRQLPQQVRAKLKASYRSGVFANGKPTARAVPDELVKLTENVSVQDVFSGDLRAQLSDATPAQYNVLATQILYVSRAWNLVGGSSTDYGQLLGKQRLEL